MMTLNTKDPTYRQFQSSDYLPYLLDAFDAGWDDAACGRRKSGSTKVKRTDSKVERRDYIPDATWREAVIHAEREGYEACQQAGSRTKRSFAKEMREKREDASKKRRPLFGRSKVRKKDAAEPERPFADRLRGESSRPGRFARTLPHRADK